MEAVLVSHINSRILFFNEIENDFERRPNMSLGRDNREE
jgi:hypothetical protein